MIKIKFKDLTGSPILTNEATRAQPKHVRHTHPAPTTSGPHT